MKKLDSLLQEIKTSVLLFEGVSRLTPSLKKATQLLTIYSIVASQIKEATELVKANEQSVSQKQRNLVRLLNKNLPKSADLRALFIALRGDVSLQYLLKMDKHTMHCLYVLLSQEAIEIIQNLNPETFGPEDDYTLPINKETVQKKEKQFLKILGDIVLHLQMTVDSQSSKEKHVVSLEDLQRRKK